MTPRDEQGSAARLGTGQGDRFRYSYWCEVCRHHFLSSEQHFRCLWGCEDDSFLHLLVLPEAAFALAADLDRCEVHG